MNYRKMRRRPSVRGSRKIQVNFAPVIVIICLSVFAGYLTAKYVVYPVLGYDPAGLTFIQEKETQNTKESGKDAEADSSIQESVSALQETSETNIVEDQAEVKKTSGYALQFGSYSTRSAADKSVKQLKHSGIEAKVMEKDGAYKVIGEVFRSKEDAKAALEKLDESVGAFVASVEV